MKYSLVPFLLASVFLGSRQVAHADSYMFTSLSLPAGVEAQVGGLNDSDQIVGYFLDGVHPYQGFLFDHGTFSIVNVPGASETEINAINNSGQMVGTPGRDGFLYSGGAFTLINHPNAISTEFLDINNAGIISGRYLDTTDRFHGFLYSNGVFTDIARLESVDAINDLGQVVGHEGILDTNGVFTPLNISGATFSKFGFNNAGLVVGSFVDSSMGHGFLYQNGVLTVVNAPNAAFPYGTEALPDINNLNQIVGEVYTGGSGAHPFLATPVPEPGSFLMVALVIGACAIFFAGKSAIVRHEPPGEVRKSLS